MAPDVRPLLPATLVGDIEPTHAEVIYAAGVTLHPDKLLGKRLEGLVEALKYRLVGIPRFAKGTVVLSLQWTPEDSDG